MNILKQLNCVMSKCENYDIKSFVILSTCFEKNYQCKFKPFQSKFKMCIVVLMSSMANTDLFLFLNAAKRAQHHSITSYCSSVLQQPANISILIFLLEL